VNTTQFYAAQDSGTEIGASIDNGRFQNS